LLLLLYFCTCISQWDFTRKDINCLPYRLHGYHLHACRKKAIISYCNLSSKTDFFFISAKCHHSGIIFHLSSTDEAIRYGLNGSGSRASYPSGRKRLSRSNIRPDQLRGWSEKFSASTKDGKTIGKIFFS